MAPLVMAFSWPRPLGQLCPFAASPVMVRPLTIRLPSYRYSRIGSFAPCMPPRAAVSASIVHTARCRYPPRNYPCIPPEGWTPSFGQSGHSLPGGGGTPSYLLDDFFFWGGERPRSCTETPCGLVALVPFWCPQPTMHFPGEHLQTCFDSNRSVSIIKPMFLPPSRPITFGHRCNQNQKRYQPPRGPGPAVSGEWLVKRDQPAGSSTHP